MIVDHQPSRHGRMGIRQHAFAYVAPRHERKDPDLTGSACLTIPLPNDYQRRRQLACESQACEWPSAGTADPTARRSLDALYLGAKLAAFTGHVVDWSRCWAQLAPSRSRAGDAADYIRHSPAAALRVADPLVTSHHPILAEPSGHLPRLDAKVDTRRFGPRDAGHPRSFCTATRGHDGAVLGGEAARMLPVFGKRHPPPRNRAKRFALTSASSMREAQCELGCAQSVCCVRRWCKRRILSRLPQVVIEHQRRRPLVLRNSQPQPRPGQRLTRARRRGSASNATASVATA